MKRINLTKYGFIRSPEEDFSDDGFHFTCYKVGKVRVSKTIYSGVAYISARIINNELNYDEYSILPHYKSLSDLNGIPVEYISDDDLIKLEDMESLFNNIEMPLIKLYNNCIEYEKEYNQKVIELKSLTPSYETAINQIKTINGARKKELDDLVSRFNLLAFANLNITKKDRFMNYFTSLKLAILSDEEIKFRVQYDFKQNAGYIRDKYSEKAFASKLQPSYWYTECVNILNVAIDA